MNTNHNFGYKILKDCPRMEVDISTRFLRYCDESYYWLRYCNQGTSPAEDVFIEVELDSLLTFVESSLPPSTQNGNLLRFYIGKIATLDCNSFRLKVEVTCDTLYRGATHCTKATIYPNEYCEPSSDEFRFSLEEKCENDSIFLTAICQ